LSFQDDLIRIGEPDTSCPANFRSRSATGILEMP
jgi:hypothetical protein